MQLEAAQREVRTTQGRAERATHELGAKLRGQRLDVLSHAHWAAG